MSCVSINKSFAPLWQQLQTDTTFEVLFCLVPEEVGVCSLVCQRWNQFLKRDYVWQQLAHCHFPFITPGVIKTFQTYLNLDSNIANGVCSVTTLEEHTSSVCSLLIEGKRLISGSNDQTIKVWDLETKRCTHTLEGHTDRICSLAAAGEEVYSGSDDKTIKKWNLKKNTCDTFHGHTGRVLLLTLENEELFSACGEQMVKIWNLKDDICRTTYKGSGRYITSLAIKDGKLFSSSSDSKMIKFWDLRNNTCTDLQGHGSYSSSIVIKGEKLFSGAFDRKINIWDLGDNTCIATLQGHTNNVSSLAIEGRWLFSGSWDKTIKAWDLKDNNKCKATLQEHTNYICSLAAKDGRLYSGSVDKTIKIWDFTANHSLIFEEIASALERQDLKEASFALQRFTRMPKKAKNKIFDNLYEILKPQMLQEYPGCAEDAFYGQNEQSATPAQKAQAIRGYLQVDHAKDHS